MEKEKSTLDTHSSEAWDPVAYWREYYGNEEIQDDERMMFSFTVDVLTRSREKFDRMIDIGCGPTVHRLAPFASYADMIDLADFEQSNLDQIEKWRGGDKSALSWTKFFELTDDLQRQHGGHDHKGADIQQLLLQRKIAGLFRCDVRLPQCSIERARYPLVTSFLCLESATAEVAVWREYCKNVIDVLKPGGRFFLATLIDTKAYEHNGSQIQCCPLVEDDVLGLLKESFIESSIESASIELGKEDLPVYANLGRILIVSAVKR